MGGVVGLRGNEVPTILEVGEEVLTRGDPRHSANGGGDVNVAMQVSVSGAVGDRADVRRSTEELRRGVQSEIQRWAEREMRPGGILHLR